MKIKLGIFFGGVSVEHEVAIITANQVMSNIDKEKYEIIPIYISKKGILYTGEELTKLKNFRNIEELLVKCIQVTIINEGDRRVIQKYPTSTFGKNIINTIDVAFPVMHGTNGEDGTIQGFLELLNIPYVGCDVLSSAVGMDKIIMKKVLKESGLPVLDYVNFYSNDWNENRDEILDNINKKLIFPLIVKAGNLGSSVGIKKAKTKETLEEAIDFAVQFSDRVIVEKAIEKLKEINCSVIGDMIHATPSVCEEPVGSDEILSYTDKYVSKGSSSKGMSGAKRRLPADISEDQTKTIQQLAVDTFKCLGCRGVSRVDLMIDEEDNQIYVNEINTIPGAMSYYLWEATDKTFATEIDELIELALKRNRERNNITFSYEQNILALAGGTKGGMKS
jgi:D-alanine--D-alanine ligase